MKRNTLSAKLTVIFVALAGLLLFFNPLHAWDDLTMIANTTTSNMPPNIMILFDNSGSMMTVIFHPDYKDNVTYSGTIYDAPTSIYVSNSPYVRTYTRYIKDGTAYSGYQYGRVRRDLVLFGRRNNAQSVRYPLNYLKWLYLHATDDQLSDVNFFHQNGYWPGQPAPTDGDPLDRILRITVAKASIIKVIGDVWADYEADPNTNKKSPRIGLNYFDTDTGALQKQGCHTKSDLQSFESNVKGLTADTWTPLSEALLETWSYFRGTGMNVSSNNNQYPLHLLTNPFSSGSSNFPITDWCQLNFCIIMTDGEPTQDKEIVFIEDDNTTLRTDKKSLFYWENLATWGYNPDGGKHPDLNYGDDGKPSGVKTIDSDGTNLLDDVAAFMYREDLFPDKKADGSDNPIVTGDSNYELKLKNKQFIYTYSIGFTIDNLLLKNTADAGGGEYYTANDYEELVAAMKQVLGSIEEKTNAYAGFTAPKLTSIGSDYTGYISTFVNKSSEALWEGHLKGYTLNKVTGGFYTITDTNSADYGTADPAHMLWDAATKLNEMTAADRTLWTWFGNAKKDVQPASFSNADLDAIDEAQRKYILAVIRGDNTDSAIFPDPKTYPFLKNEKPRRLGDIFHFQPQIVGQPLYWKTAFDASYASFYEEYKDRTRAVYAGANDGFLHCFDAASGQELWGFLPSVNLKKLKDLALNTKGAHQYFVDGQGLPIEIKIDFAGTDHNAWISLFTFSLGMGGKAYYGLNVTNPNEPQFLWELAVYPFGANANKTVLNLKNGTSQVLSDLALLGPTMGKPTVGTLRVDNSQVQAVILSGGFHQDRATVNREGKSLFILNAHTGELIKMFRYGLSSSNSSTEQVSPNLLYSIPASPLLVDYQNDGIHDAIYFGDVGGQVFKISLNSTNSANWTLDKIFSTNQSFTGGVSPQGFFITPTVGYDDAYNIWVFAGTGNRADAYDLDNTGMFFAFKDDGNDGAGYDPTDLQDISDLFISTAMDDTDGDGWSDTIEQTHNKNIYDKNDHPDPEDVPRDMVGKDIDPLKQGVYLDFPNGNGEKLFEPSPIYIDKRIIFNTFLPPETINETPCEITGKMRLYQFRINALGGGDGSAPKIDANTSIDARILGSGLFTSGQYNVYLGVGEIGSDQFLGGDDEGGNMKINLSDIFGPMFWKEKRR